VIVTLKAVDEFNVSVAVTVSRYVAAVVEFVAARVGSRTIKARFVCEVSRVIPEIVGAIVKVLFPVPEEAMNGDDLVSSP
jgi:hypothetical protein